MFKTIFKICFYLPVAIIGAFLAWCIVGFMFVGFMTGFMMPTPSAKTMAVATIELPARDPRR